MHLFMPQDVLTKFDVCLNTVFIRLSAQPRISAHPTAQKNNFDDDIEVVWEYITYDT